MADRANHYERALAAHLRSQAMPCIPVDESRRGWIDDWSVKSLDFIVAVGGGRLLLVDVKGRRLTRHRRTRETWATADDVKSLETWQRQFGAGATALLVFVYLVEDGDESQSFVDRFELDGNEYGLLAVSLSEYRARMRVRSPRWQTVCLSQSDFRRVARPLSFWLGKEELAADTEPTGQD